jgi:hypothetical protein
LYHACFVMTMGFVGLGGIGTKSGILALNLPKDGVQVRENRVSTLRYCAVLPQALDIGFILLFPFLH